MSNIIYSRDLATIIKALKSMDKRLATVNSNLEKLNEKVSKIVPTDVDPFDPEDDEDVTEDDLPFVVPGSADIRTL